MKEVEAATLIAQLEMGDFQALKRVRLVLLFYQPRSQGPTVKWQPQEELSVGKRGTSPSL